MPHWAKDLAFGNKCINARAETVATSPAFRDAASSFGRYFLRFRRLYVNRSTLLGALRQERRRTKIIPHAFGERVVLKLMYAALIRAA